MAQQTHGSASVKNVIASDARGRITLGNRARSKRYQATFRDSGEIILVPVAVVPERALQQHDKNGDDGDDERWQAFIDGSAGMLVALAEQARAEDEVGLTRSLDNLT